MPATVATVTTTPDVVLDFDTRLALTGAHIDHRLALAGLAVSVNSAHIDIEPVPVIDAPVVVLRPAVACPYTTPVAALLWKARQILEDRGWNQGHLRGEQGEVCLMGAVQYAAPGSSHISRALDVLLEAIRKDFDTPSIAHWNDRLRDPFLAYRYLDQATELAHQRGQ
jgi:hypothetical protein